MATSANWPRAIRPLLKKYQSAKHPLEYKNTYQLLVMVVLSAQDSDRHINKIAPDFFKVFPKMATLAKATEAAIEEQISDVRNFGNKAKWLSGIAKTIKKDTAIPLSLEALTALKGIGRKSANVILRESGQPPEGVIVDLHVVRVAPRLGIANGSDANKIEKQLMAVLPQKDWDAGMALSFLGREICRPKDPACPKCVMNKVCAYYNHN